MERTLYKFGSRNRRAFSYRFVSRNFHSNSLCPNMPQLSPSGSKSKIQLQSKTLNCEFDRLAGIRRITKGISWAKISTSLIINLSRTRSSSSGLYLISKIYVSNQLEFSPTLRGIDFMMFEIQFEVVLLEDIRTNYHLSTKPIGNPCSPSKTTLLYLRCQCA